MQITELIYNAKTGTGETITRELTEEEIARNEQSEKQSRLNELKLFLAETDYKAIKYAEGKYTEEEYAPISEQREAWREEIRALEKQLGE